MTVQPVSLGALALLAVLMATAVWLDVSQRRLPNWLALATLATAIGATVLLSGWGALGWHAAHAALALAVTIGIYALGWFGAGDAKFYSAVAMWFPLNQGLALLFAVSAIGLVAVLLWLTVIRIRRRARGERKADGHFPLGVPIALGAFALQLSSVMPLVLGL